MPWLSSVLALLAFTSARPRQLVVVASAPVKVAGLSWSANGAELAIGGPGQVTIFNSSSLSVVRTLPLKALALGEHCFEAVVPAKRGVDVVDLADGTTVRFSVDPHHRHSTRPASAPKAYVLADDCTHLSIYPGDDGPVEVFSGSRRIRYGDSGASGAAMDVGAVVTASGRFLQWSETGHGGASTWFQDLRRPEHVVSGSPDFGLGSEMSADDRFVLDTGFRYYNDGWGPNRRPSLVAVASGRELFQLAYPPFEATPEGAPSIVFSPRSSLVALFSGRRVRIFATSGPKCIAKLDLADRVKGLSFSPDETLLAVITAKGLSVLSIKP